MKLRASAWIAIFLLSAISVWARQSDKDPILFHPKVKCGTLKNGFRYFILDEPQSNKKVRFNFVVKVGYPDETPGQLGTAHLVEHIATRSAKNFPEGIWNFLKNKDAYENAQAHTGNSTLYHFEMNEDNRVLLTSGILALRNIAADVSFLPAEVDEERSAVAREFSRGTSKSFLAFYEVKDQLLDVPVKYPQRVSDEISAIGKIPMDSIRRFYKDWYRPDNQAIIIVGDVNEAAIEREITRLFSDLKNDGLPKRRLNKKSYPAAVPGKNTLILVEDAPGSLFELQLYKIRRSESNVRYPQSTGEYRIAVIDQLVNEMLRNRIKALTTTSIAAIQGSGLALTRNAVISNSGVDAFQGQTYLQHVAEIKPVVTFMIQELKRMEQFGFSSAELDRARQKFLHHPITYESVESLLIMHYEYGSAVPENAAQLKQQIARTIELKEINQLVKRFLSQKNNLALVLTIPENIRGQLASEDTILGWMDEALKSDVTPYVQETIKEPVLPVLKTAAASSYRVKEITGLDATEVILENGIRIILKTLPQNPTNGVDIFLKGFKCFGSSDPRYKMSSVMQGLSGFMGIGSLNSTERKAWHAWQAEIGSPVSASPYIRSDEAGIIGSARNDNAEKLLQLVRAYFTTASLDTLVFRQTLTMHNAASSRKKSSVDILQDSINALMRNARSKAGQTNDSNPITSDRVSKLYKNSFASADGFSFVITGSFDKQTIMELASRYLGSLPASDKRHSCAKENSVIPGGIYNHKAVFVGDSIGNVDVSILFKGLVKPSTLDRLKLDLLREIINRKLFTRLREKDKGVYGVSAEVQQTSDGSAFYLDIKFETKAEDVERLTKSVQDELNKLSNGELEDSLFNNAVAIVRERVSHDNNSIFYWNTYLVDQIRQGNFSDEGIKRLEMLDSITSKDIAQAMRKFFNPDEYMLFELL